MRRFWEDYKAWGNTRTAKVMCAIGLVLVFVWNVWWH